MHRKLREDGTGCNLRYYSGVFIQNQEVALVWELPLNITCTNCVLIIRAEDLCINFAVTAVLLFLFINLDLYLSSNVIVTHYSTINFIKFLSLKIGRYEYLH